MNELTFIRGRHFVIFLLILVLVGCQKPDAKSVDSSIVDSTVAHSWSGLIDADLYSAPVTSFLPGWSSDAPYTLTSLVDGVSGKNLPSGITAVEVVFTWNDSTPNTYVYCYLNETICNFPGIPGISNGTLGTNLDGSQYMYTGTVNVNITTPNTLYFQVSKTGTGNVATNFHVYISKYYK